MRKILALIAFVIAGPAFSQDKAFSLQAPKALVETGLLKHMLPRFALKHGIRITVTSEAGDVVIGTEGTPIFRQGETVWHLTKTDGPHTDTFLTWLQSDVGKRTIDTFAPGGTALFNSDVSVVPTVQTAALEGNAALGEELSLRHCGRCHVVSDKNRMNAIGSSPSFGLMRTFPDWQERFETFFMLKPHPAFTQVKDITEPFAENLPSPIIPIEVTWEQIEAITAFVGSIPPADLGAPIKSQ